MIYIYNIIIAEMTAVLVHLFLIAENCAPR